MKGAPVRAEQLRDYREGLLNVPSVRAMSAFERELFLEYKVTQFSDYLDFNDHLASALAAYEGRSDDLSKLQSRTWSRKAAASRYATDPKQQAKERVLEAWKLWSLDANRYRSKAAFARDMLDKFEVLRNQKVIERWCADWESAQRLRFVRGEWHSL